MCYVILYSVPPPRIIEHPIDIELPVTQTAMFECVGHGYGFVDVSWLRTISNNERSLPSKSTVTTMVSSDNIATITSVLTISDLADSKRGNYWCVYTNSGGETHSRIADLTIESM